MLTAKANSNRAGAIASGRASLTDHRAPRLSVNAKHQAVSPAEMNWTALALRRPYSRSSASATTTPATAGSVSTCHPARDITRTSRLTAPPPPPARLPRSREDVVAQRDAAVADVDPRPGDQLLALALRFPQNEHREVPSTNLVDVAVEDPPDLMCPPDRQRVGPMSDLNIGSGRRRGLRRPKVLAVLRMQRPATVRLEPAGRMAIVRRADFSCEPHGPVTLRHIQPVGEDAAETQLTRWTGAPARIARGISAISSTTSSRCASCSDDAEELTWTE